MERKVKKRIEDLAKIFNSEETKQVEIRIRYWGFFKVAKWNYTNVRDSAWILYWNPDAKNVIEVDGVKFSSLMFSPWTVAFQSPLSMGFSQEYWSGGPFPYPTASANLELVSGVECCHLNKRPLVIRTDYLKDDFITES